MSNSSELALHAELANSEGSDNYSSLEKLSNNSTLSEESFSEVQSYEVPNEDASGVRFQPQTDVNSYLQNIATQSTSASVHYGNMCPHCHENALLKTQLSHEIRRREQELKEELNRHQAEVRATEDECKILQEKVHQLESTIASDKRLFIQNKSMLELQLQQSEKKRVLIEKREQIVEERAREIENELSLQQNTHLANSKRSEAENDVLKRENAKLLEHLEELNEELLLLKNNAEDLELQNRNLESDLALEKRREEDITTHAKEEVEAAYKLLSDQASQHTRKINELSSAISAAETDKQRAEELAAKREDDFQVRITELQHKLSVLSAQLSSVNHQQILTASGTAVAVASNFEACDGFSDKVAPSEAEYNRKIISSLKQKVSELKAENSSLQITANELTATERELSDALQLSDRLRRELSVIKKESADEKACIKELTMHNTLLKQQLEASEKVRADTIRRMEQDAEQQGELVTAQNRQLKEENDLTRARITVLEHAIQSRTSKFHDDYKILRKKCTNYGSLIKKLRYRIEVMQSSSEILQARYEALQSSRAGCHDHCRRLKKRLLDINNKQIEFASYLRSICNSEALQETAELKTRMTVINDQLSGLKLQMDDLFTHDLPFPKSSLSCKFDRRHSSSHYDAEPREHQMGSVRPSSAYALSVRHTRANTKGFKNALPFATGKFTHCQSFNAEDGNVKASRMSAWHPCTCNANQYVPCDWISENSNYCYSCGLLSKLPRKLHKEVSNVTKNEEIEENLESYEDSMAVLTSASFKCLTPSTNKSSGQSDQTASDQQHSEQSESHSAKTLTKIAKSQKKPLLLVNRHKKAKKQNKKTKVTKQKNVTERSEEIENGAKASHSESSCSGSSAESPVKSGSNKVSQSTNSESHRLSDKKSASESSSYSKESKKSTGGVNDNIVISDARTEVSSSFTSTAVVVTLTTSKYTNQMGHPTSVSSNGIVTNPVVAPIVSSDESSVFHRDNNFPLPLLKVPTNRVSEEQTKIHTAHSVSHVQPSVAIEKRIEEKVLLSNGVSKDTNKKTVLAETLTTDMNDTHYQHPGIRSDRGQVECPRTYGPSDVPIIGDRQADECSGVETIAVNKAEVRLLQDSLELNLEKSKDAVAHNEDDIEEVIEGGDEYSDDDDWNGSQKSPPLPM